MSANLVHVTQVLAGIDFTPVTFSKTDEGPKENKLNSNAVDWPPPAYHGFSPKEGRGSWIFSAQNRFTVQVSTTPPLLSEMGPVPQRLAGKVVVDEK
jgi:hypothetical protein